MQVHYSTKGSYMADKLVGKIFETKDYDRFKILEGNRPINHVKKLIVSIQSIGMLMRPVLVNEKFEIIDGQGTFSACKYLRLPVPYVIQPGLTIRECRFLNRYQTKWSVNDFINSYAVGNDSREVYRNLKVVMDQFPDINKKVVIKAATPTGISATNTTCLSDGAYEGMDLEGMNRAISRLIRLRPFANYLSKAPYKINWLSAIVFCLAIRDSNPAFSDEQLLEGIKAYYDTCPKASSLKQAIQNCDTCYNYKRRKENRFNIYRYYEDVTAQTNTNNLSGGNK